MADHDDHEEREDAQSLRGPGRETEHVTPAVDIYETGNGHVLLADMPGVTRDGLAVHVERDQLAIRGRVPHDSETKPQHREFQLRDYYRAFTLGDDIDADEITASLNDGVLRLTLPKSSRAKVRKITVT